MSKTIFQTLVRDFGQHLGVPDVAADDDGYVALTFDETEVHFQYDDERDEMVIFTVMGEVDDLRADEVYAMLLAANLFWRGGRGATFSAEPELGRVFLADRRPLLNLSLTGLNTWIEHFLDTTEYWQMRLDVANKGESPAVARAPGADHGRNDKAGHQGLDFHVGDA